MKLAWIAVAGARRAGRRGARTAGAHLRHLSVGVDAGAARRCAELLERGATVREQIARRVSVNYPAAARKTASAASRACVLESEGGWYGGPPGAVLESEEALVVDLLRDDGVLAHPGYFFDFPRESYLVVSLLAPEAQFAEGPIACCAACIAGRQT